MSTVDLLGALRHLFWSQMGVVSGIQGRRVGI